MTNNGFEIHVNAMHTYVKQAADNANKICLFDIACWNVKSGFPAWLSLSEKLIYLQKGWGS